MPKKHSLLWPIVEENQNLVWYVKKKKNLSDESIFEHVLNYGSWEEVQQAIDLLGIDKAKEHFYSLASKPRSNLKHRVKHYFNLYFSAHA